MVPGRPPVIRANLGAALVGGVNSSVSSSSTPGNRCGGGCPKTTEAAPLDHRHRPLQPTLATRSLHRLIQLSLSKAGEYATARLKDLQRGVFEWPRVLILGNPPCCARTRDDPAPSAGSEGLTHSLASMRRHPDVCRGELPGSDDVVRTISECIERATQTMERALDAA